MGFINRGAVLAACASSLLMPGLVTSARAEVALDHGIDLSFTALPDQITWQLTGSDLNTSFVNGTLGPFNHACAILQGLPTTQGNVVKRDIYVLDSGISSSEVVLYVYARTDTITSSGGQRNDAVTIVPRHAVPLGLSGASNASCYMAANATAIFAGTSANLSAEIIYKDSLLHDATAQQSISYGFTVSAITASDNGIVFVTWGTGPDSGWAEYDQNAKLLEGGLNFNFTVLAGSTNATTY